MATIQSIINRVSFVTKDLSNVRWSLPELALWLNEAKDLIVAVSSRAAADYYVLTLKEGPQQDLRDAIPDKAWIMLFELVCNVDTANGVDTPTGSTIRRVDRAALDDSYRTWRSQPPTATEVREYTQDARHAYAFTVRPPVAAGTKVYALAAAQPPACAILNSAGDALADPNETFPLAPGFDGPAVDYVLYRAFSKDVNDPASAGRAQTHFQAFQSFVSAESGVYAATSVATGSAK